jgi:hypothetical protein
VLSIALSLSKGTSSNVPGSILSDVLSIALSLSKEKSSFHFSSKS